MMGNTYTDNNNNVTTSIPIQFNGYKNKLYVWLITNILGGVINLCLIFAILCFTSYRRPTNFLIAFLAFSSILTILTTAPTYYEREKGREWYQIPYFCEFMTFIRRLPQPMMSFTTVLIVLDRKRFMKNHLARPSLFIYIKQMLLVILASLILSIPRFFERKYDPSIVGTHKCKKVLILDNEWITIVYNLIHLFCTYIYPTIILSKEIWLSKNILRGLFSSTERQFVFEHKRAQFVLIICMFSLGFIICWPQHGIFYILVNLPVELIGQTLLNQFQYCWYYSRIVFYPYTIINPTLPFVLCFDWKWTTCVELIQSNPRNQRAVSGRHQHRLNSVDNSSRSKESIELLRRKSDLFEFRVG